VKRSSLPPRGKPLDPGTKGLQRTGISRTSTLGRGTGKPRSTLPCPSPGPKAKRPSVSPEERRARQLVKARAAGRCEGCGTTGPTDWSHRIGRGVGGPWCASNGLALCRLRCHSGVVGDQPVAARDQLGWRLRSTDKPAELPAWHWQLGFVLLDADGGQVQVDADDALRALAA
jgi:hypothetical protein